MRDDEGERRETWRWGRAVIEGGEVCRGALAGLDGPVGEHGLREGEAAGVHGGQGRGAAAAWCRRWCSQGVDGGKGANSNVHWGPRGSGGRGLREVGEAGERVVAWVDMSHDRAAQAKGRNGRQLERIVQGQRRQRWGRGGRGGEAAAAAALWVLAEVEEEVKGTLLLAWLHGGGSSSGSRGGGGGLARPAWETLVVVSGVAVIRNRFEVGLAGAQPQALVLAGTLRLVEEGQGPR